MSEIICPECDAINKEEKDICRQCGFPLDEMGSSEEAVQAPTSGIASTSVSFSMRPQTPQPDTSPATPEPEHRPHTPASRVNTTFKPADPDAEPDPVILSTSGTLPVPPPIPVPPPSTTAPGHATSTRTGGSWKLSVVEGFRVGKEYLIFRPEMVIGRVVIGADTYPDIDLADQDDDYVSQRHAVIRQTDAGITIEDLGGPHGTSLNNCPIPSAQQMPVNEDDVVRIGKVGLQLKSHKTGR